MKRRGMSILRALVLAVPGLPAASGAAGEFALSKGADAKSRAEAAEVSFLHDADKGSSTAVAAAVIWAPQASYSSTWGTLQWDLAAGIHKNTIAGDKRVEKHLLAIGGRHVLALAPGAHVRTRAAFERRRNRLSRGDESAFSAMADLNLDALKTFGPGFQAKVFPQAGAYRTSTRGNSGPTALNGSFGGLVLGADLAVDVFQGMRRAVVVDLSWRRQFEARTTGDFTDRGYNLGSVDLKIPFAAWGGQGAVSLGHVRGTDRLAGLPARRQTLIKLTLKLGDA